MVKGKITEDPAPGVGNGGRRSGPPGSSAPSSASSTPTSSSGASGSSEPSGGSSGSSGSAASVGPSGSASAPASGSASGGGTSGAATDAEAAKLQRKRTLKDAGRELLLVALLFGVYKLGRGLVSGETSAAYANAKQLLTMQKDLRLPDEAAFQEWFMQSHTAVLMCNKYYAYVHFPATVAFLLWLWIRHRDHYRWVRNILAVMTGIALIIHMLVPLAPPRMMPGFTDTGKDSGDSPYAGAGAKIANQFAAMPSLHVGWAVVVALGMAVVWRTATGPSRRIASWAVWLHPAITLLVVVVTANHYWLDAVVALLLLVFALAVLPGPGQRPGAGLPRRIPAPRTAR
ncbi:phosphatase PAP2 family protein [Streptomyces sp. SID3343]|uniref:phosphatase PAP2 family protein n=1 Tax=Streptomyces sp. SID3343 TaxID=2690260 RepID=UPI0031F8202B